MGRDIGFIGLGRMGRPMASRLIDAGHRLTVHDVRAEALTPLLDRGARAAPSPAAVADAAELVMASLPTPEIVRAVALGPDGVAAGGRVRTFLDLSTSGPRTIAAIAESLAAKGIATVDCPVSGGVGGAERGTLAVMVAAPRPLFEEVAELLAAIGKVFHVGDRPGMGQTMKLANNLLSAAAMAVTSEAMVMGVKAGLDPQVMLDVINAGSGRNTATQDKFPRAILTRGFDHGFTTGLMYKDVRLCLDEAENLQVPMWVASAVRQLWFLAQSQIGAEKDFTTIVQCVENWAGVEVRKR